MSYDSTADTLKHIKRVSELLSEAAIELLKRGSVHDATKLVSPEKEGFDNAQALKSLTYDSPEYKQSLENLKEVLQHHYQHNSHHPEHYEKGINDMDLFDIVEMFFDWKAATERVKDGNIYESINKNSNRFEMDEQLVNIFINTAKRKGY